MKPVLIFGKPRTGKSLFARRLVNMSKEFCDSDIVILDNVGLYDLHGKTAFAIIHRLTKDDLSRRLSILQDGRFVVTSSRPYQDHSEPIRSSIVNFILITNESIDDVSDIVKQEFRCVEFKENE